VLFPRAGSYQASIEVKKRLLALTPHMGGKVLKELARTHSRRGTMDSFVADLESRLDKFIYRLNLVPSIFAARQVIGHGHILVNGHRAKRAGMLLQPQDIVEPTATAIPLFKRLIRQRLNSNTFKIVGDGGGSNSTPAQSTHASSRPATAVLTDADFNITKLKQDAAAYVQTGDRRLPPDGASTAMEDTDGPELLLQRLLLSLLPALGGQHPLAQQLQAQRTQLRLRLPRVAKATKSQPVAPVTIEHRSGEPSKLMNLDRVRTRRLLLALLALRPARSVGAATH